MHLRANEIPAEGEIVWVQGYEFIASDVSVAVNEGDPKWPHPHDGRKIMRFTGRCTDNPVNDPIRNTCYNGGRYGWSVN